ncbi:MAG: hypothetical protein LQ337_008995, partial [Flavoplaca oasis]
MQHGTRNVHGPLGGFKKPRHDVEHRRSTGWNAEPPDDRIRFASAASAKSVVQHPRMTLGIQFLCSCETDACGSLRALYFGDVGGLSLFWFAAAMLAAARDPNSIH